MPFTNNGNVRLHWEEQGQGSPILLIMGHAFSGDLWYPVIPALSEEHRVIWFDNRGTGQSDSTRDAHISDLSGDARAVLDAAGVESADVYGVSMGGGVAIQLAYESPQRVRSLILGCTALKSESLPVKSRSATLVYYLPMKVLRKAFRTSMYGPACPPEAAERDLDVLMKMKKSPRGLIAQVKAMESYAMTADKVATLKMPALILHGDADDTVDISRAEELAATLPDNRLIVYPGAGHNFIVAYTEKSNQDVLAFLQEVERQSAAV
jgi:3-oxoadipate enol-lactonase